MLEQLTQIFEQNINKDFAFWSKKYMKERFEFLGLRHPLRKNLNKNFIDSCNHLSSDELVNIAFELFDKPYREYHYTAIDMLAVHYKKLDRIQMIRLFQLIDTHSWWDSVDYLYKVFYLWLYKLNPQYLEEFCLTWNQGSLWQKRMALIIHLK